MKKYTYNTFQKGINLDQHPLTVPNDTLTDALNATILTMNGNEGILQNDMGNGRVESAFLPSGYVPVGIKEHGGIIYVASYNPLTNKGQIGSFPSPERNYNQEELTNRQIELELLNKNYTKSFNNFDNITGLGQLENKVQILDQPIRSGDKFAICFNSNNKNNDDNLKYISFFTERNLVNLYIQVLDANNNLRDITDQLKIVDNPSINGNKYFMANVSPPAEGTSVDEIRNIYANYLNTYNNKLFGKLFLVGKVNVVDHIDAYVDVNVTGNKYKFTWTVTYYYKCPFKYLIGPQVNFKIGKDTDEIKKLTTNTAVHISYGAETQYNDELYSYTYTITASKNKKDVADKIMYYRIVPKMQNIPNSNQTINYLPHIAIEGTVNLALIGTGQIDINRWNYKYQGGLLTLSYGFDIDISGKYKFSDLVFECENALDSSDKVTINIPPKFKYSGVFTEVFSELDQGKIYIVTPKIKRGEDQLTLSKRIIITTNIYNDLFQEILDYGDANNTETLNAIQEHNKLIFTNKTNIKLAINNPTIVDQAYKIVKEGNNISEESLDGILPYFSTEKDIDDYTLHRKNNFNVSETIELDLTLDPDKYPFKEVDCGNAQNIEISSSVGEFIQDSSLTTVKDNTYIYKGTISLEKFAHFKQSNNKTQYVVTLYKSIYKNFVQQLQDQPFICPVFASYDGEKRCTLSLVKVTNFDIISSWDNQQRVFEAENVDRSPHSIKVELTTGMPFWEKVDYVLNNSSRPFIFTSLDNVSTVFNNKPSGDRDDFLKQITGENKVPTRVNTAIFKKQIIKDMYHERGGDRQAEPSTFPNTDADDKQYWYYLFLKDSSGNFVVLNIFNTKDTCYTDLDNMLKDLLGDLCNIYYRSENTTSIDLYKQEITYKEDSSQEELYLINTINNINISKIDGQNISENKLVLNNNGINKELITFTIDSSNIKLNSQIKQIPIIGFEDFDIDTPDGMIEESTCLTDNIGQLLKNNFYYYKNNVINGKDYSTLTNKLTIENNNILIKYGLAETSLDYDFAAGNFYPSIDEVWFHVFNKQFKLLQIPDLGDVYDTNRKKLKE